MKLLKIKRKNQAASSIIYYTMVLLVPIAILVLVHYVDSIWPALAVMLLSKWRVLAVRPRYWYANIVSNAVDVIIGVGNVIFVYAASPALWLQIALTIGYMFWLVVVKPRSSRLFVTAQGIAAIFVGVSALSMILPSLDSIIYVAAMGAIGFVSARHILTSYEEPAIKMLAAIWGFVMAEMGWIFYWWLFSYSLFPGVSLYLVQSAIIATLVSFVGYKYYDSSYHHDKVRRVDVLLPAIFAGLIIVIMLKFFNDIAVNTPL